MTREIDYRSRTIGEWEERFSFWATPPSQSEQQRIDRTIREIKRAVALSPKLSGMDIKVFPQGSYANRVNVRQYSDVDVCCLVSRTVHFSLAPGMTNADTGLTFPSTYSYGQYKSDVEAALVAHFGRSAVRREGNKAIDVNAQNALLDADVVACFEYRDYNATPAHVGTALLRDDDGGLVTGFPVQHKANGQSKNDATLRRYRQQVRIIKTLRNNMDRWGFASAKDVSSFGLESLWWNAPESAYLNSDSHYGRLVLLIGWSVEQLASSPGRLWEVNGIKTLFGAHSDKTPQEYAAFLRNVASILTA